MIKHIELQGNSLAECYARFKNLDYVKVTDLCHRAKVVIDIDLDSPYDGSYLQVGTEINDNPWISVKERMPKCIYSTDGGKYSDLCLCHTENGEYLVLALNEWYSEEEGFNYFWGTYDSVYDTEIETDIDYWMPIPKLKED